MKRCTLMTTLLVAVVTILGPFISWAGEIKQVPAAINVRDIASRRDGRQGTITITGVVAQVPRGKSKAFTLVDTGEARQCKSTGCARFYLPVEYEGPTPKQWDEVNVTGSFEGGKKGVFAATKVVVLQSLNLK